jgi:16S rRNA (cytosine967-C5)-methyltransferase
MSIASEVEFRIAARVLRESTRGKAADSVLRSVLRETRLAPEQSRSVSELVFAYYRWHGWIEPKQGWEQQLREGIKLAKRFARSPEEFTDQELLTKALPAWVLEQIPESPQWARALQAEPRLWLRARAGQGRAVAAELEEASIPMPNILPDTIEYLGTRDLFHTDAFKTGQFEIQDISSQWVGILCEPKPGETWWDACAGEGGKTLHLSALMGNKGLIWASDRAQWRLDKLKRRTGRAQVFNYRPALWDGGSKLPTKTTFHGVLVDAPCSGLGTWQRNPHARWTTELKDVLELKELQKQLLQNAAKAVKPGGKMVYSVCTLARAETEEVAVAFEAGQPEFEPIEMAHPSGQKLKGRCWVQPWDLGGNGMFIAAWRRK